VDDERWIELMTNHQSRLTPEEVAAGWHFCFDWDGLLVGPGMPEIEACRCGRLFVEAANNIGGHK